jgi:hypothetical protein
VISYFQFKIPLREVAIMGDKSKGKKEKKKPKKNKK